MRSSTATASTKIRTRCTRPKMSIPVLKLMKPVPRTGAFEVSPEFHFVAYDAGHILGSTSLELTITENGKKIVVVFSGDIGRYDQPILKNPTTPSSNADVLLCESTYGDRDHEAGDAGELLAAVVNRVAQRGGSIVIPAFAIGRTQTFMYYLRELEDQQKIPRLPVYVDSPMALSATDLYVKYREDHDVEFVQLESGNGGKGDPLNVHEFHLTRTADESKAINNVKTPCIIVSASGMVSGGRVLHHLEQTAAGFAQRRDPGGISGTGHTRPRVAGRREDAAAVWAGRPRKSGNRGDGAVFGARGQKRIVALADRPTRAAKTDLPDAWRTCSGAGAAAGDPGQVSMEGRGGPLPGYRRAWRLAAFRAGTPSIRSSPESPQKTFSFHLKMFRNTGKLFGG